MSREVQVINGQMADVSRVLRGMSAAVQHDIMGPALEAASVPIARATMDLAPVETGALRASIVVKVQKYKDGGAVSIIGVNRRYRSSDGRKPSKYAHLVELGHVQVDPEKGTTLRKGTAKRIGFVHSRPFIRPGFFAGQAEARTILQREVNNRLTQVRDKEIAAGRHKA